MKFKSSKLHKTWSAVKNHPGVLLAILGLDLAFVALLLIINYLIGIVLPTNSEFISGLQRNVLTITLVVLFLIAYFVLIVLSYSVFSLLVLGNIRSMHAPHKHDFGMLKKMFVLNAFIFLIFFILYVMFVVLNALLINASSWIVVSVLIVLGLLLLFSYIFYNFMHSLLIMGHDLGTIFKRSLGHLGSKSYIGLLLWNISVIIIYIALVLLAIFIFQKTITANYNSFISLFSWITIVLAYLLFSFNRVYFFFIALEN